MQRSDFLYGAVLKLTREDTLADIERNFVQMREAGLDTAVIWPAAFWQIRPFQKRSCTEHRMSSATAVKAVHGGTTNIGVRH